jgi:SAM-dependent methyltransferase
MEAGEYATMARVEGDYWWYRGLRALVRTALQRELDGRGTLRILDDGCGTGGGMAVLGRTFGESLIVGADVAGPAVRYSAAQAAGPVVQASANSLPFRTGVFDAVVIADVLNVATVNADQALSEARRVLKTGGVLVVNVPAFEWLRGVHDAAVHTTRRFRRPELEGLLRRHGFDPRRVRYWNALLLPLAFAMRRIRRSGAGGPTSDLTALPRPLNELLVRTLAMERWLAARLDLPFGTSLIGIAIKA